MSVSGGYRRVGDKEVGFWVGPYDRSRELVIDPVLEFSSVLGGSGLDLATAVALDAANNIYITGYSQYADFLPNGSHRFPTSFSSGITLLLVKLDANTRQVIFADFFGGTSYDLPYSLAVDQTGAVTVVGATNSTNFPTVNPVLSNAIPGYQYGFATHFSSDGSRIIYSTYTAPGVYPSGTAYGVALDSSGGAWIAGATLCYTDYTDPIAHQFKPTPDAVQGACTLDLDYSGYLMHLGSGGGEIYASYYVPPTQPPGTNYVNDVAVDSQGNVYVAGTTIGPGTVVRVHSNGSAFVNDALPNAVCEVTKFNPQGHSLWTQTIGGTADQECFRIALDANGSVYTTGYTTSPDFPVSPGARQRTIGSTGQVPNPDHNPNGNLQARPLYDAFVAKWDTNGNRGYATYVGGNGDDYTFGIAVNSAGIAYVTGYTEFP